MENNGVRDDLFTDLDLFLRESERDEQVPPEPRHDEREPEEDLNSQILAGLVSF